MGLEDLTTFIEVDAAGDVVVTPTKCDVTTMRRDAVATVYRDYGAGHFLDFTHDIEVEWSEQSTSSSLGVCYSLADFGGLTFENFLLNDSGIILYLSSTDIIFASRPGGSIDSFNGVINTRYYLSVVRTSTTLQCFIYSDAARTVLLDTLTITRKTQSRYLGVCGGRGSGAAPADTISFFTQNLDLNEFVVAPVAMHYYRNQRI